MNISLKPELEEFIQAKIKTGKYENAEQVISEAFRLLEKRDRHYEKWLEETRQKVKEGLDSLDRGEGIDGEEVFKELLEEIHLAKESQQ